MLQSALKLVNFTENPDNFFRRLPAAWAKEARSIWPKIADDSYVFVLQEGDSFRGGGIVSTAVFPDMEDYRDRATEWYSRKYYYIGYLYVPSKFRSHGYGSIWLREIRNAVPARGFWLSIEKIGLLRFYAQSGFHLQQIVRRGKDTEWILVSPREDW